MGSCAVCAWCCCSVLCGCMNGASPVRFVLSLLSMGAFQMNTVCVVTSDWGLFIVYCLWQRSQIQMTVCVYRRDRI